MSYFSNGKLTFPVPNHGSRDISPGIEKQVLKLLGLTIEEFKKIQRITWICQITR
jgi:hypothetical protein